jgi:hypothetical protein
MRLTAHYDFPAAPAELAGLLARNDFWEATFTELGSPNHQVTITGSPASRFTISIRATMPPQDLPVSIRSTAPYGLQLRQAVVWEPALADGHRQASLAGEVVGAPVQLLGAIAMLPTQDEAGDGARLEYNAEIKATIPLLGRAIESAAVPAVMRVLTAQHTVALNWLSS